MHNDEFLEHHGVKGQKWGVRRYQNLQGRLTALGKKRVRDISNTESNDPDTTNKGTSTTNKGASTTNKGVDKTTTTSTDDTSSKTNAAKGSSTTKPPTNTNDKPKVALMSNEELQARIARIDLEQRYQTAITSTARKKGSASTNLLVAKLKDKGADAMADIMVQTAKTVGVKGANQALNKIFKNTDFEEYVFTNNKRK